MTRYNDKIDIDDYGGDAYRAGVDRVLWYIREIKSDWRLWEELHHAIEDGVI